MSLTRKKWKKCVGNIAKLRHEAILAHTESRNAAENATEIASDQDSIAPPLQAGEDFSALGSSAVDAVPPEWYLMYNISEEEAYESHKRPLSLITHPHLWNDGPLRKMVPNLSCCTRRMASEQHSRHLLS